jgi:hypothetical protein
MLHIWVYFYYIQIQSKSKDEKRAAMICGEGKQEWAVSNIFVGPLQPQFNFFNSTISALSDLCLWLLLLVYSSVHRVSSHW